MNFGKFNLEIQLTCKFTSVEYIPSSFFINSSCEPISTTTPFLKPAILSAVLIVDRRCAITMVVLPSLACKQRCVLDGKHSNIEQNEVHNFYKL